MPVEFDDIDEDVVNIVDGGDTFVDDDDVGGDVDSVNAEERGGNDCCFRIPNVTSVVAAAAAAAAAVDTAFPVCFPSVVAR